jgi:transitional endoplasmic reticulum ATPase
MGDNLTLRVQDLPAEFAHQGIIAVSDELLAVLNARPGEVASIHGGRETWGRLVVNEEIEEGHVHVDATTRLNAGVPEGGQIQLEVEEATPLSSIVLARVGRPPEEDIEQLIRGRLRDRILCQGDHITLPAPGGVLELQVVRCRPKKGILNENTKANIHRKAAKRPLVSTSDVSFADIGGLAEQIERLQECAIVPLLHPELFIHSGKEPIRGVLLHGEPGTGKGMLAKALARECHCTFIAVSAPELIQGVYGESEKGLRNIFERAKKEAPAVIFIDEVDAIGGCREESRGGMGQSLVTQLLVLMDGMQNRGQVMVIGATNRIDSLDGALRRAGRFEREIECPVPNEEARREILGIHTRHMPLNQDVELDELARLSVGFVGADLDQLCRESVYVGGRRQFGFDGLMEDTELDPERLSELTYNMEDFENALGQVRPSIKRRMEIEIPKITFEHVIGQLEAKNALHSKVVNPLKHPELHQRAGLVMGCGILMHGPPGNGKTMLAKAVANLAGAQFLQVKGPELLSKWVGESERGVRTLFAKARKMSPCIIFFDEFDSLGADRSSLGDGGSRAHANVVNQLLTELDGMESRDGIVVLAATNRPNLIDPAFLRPGRLGVHVVVGAPQRADYPDLIGVHLRDTTLADEIDLSIIAASLPDKLSGADVAGFVTEVKQQAVQRNLKSEDYDIEDFKIVEADFGAVLSMPQWKTDQKPRNGAEIPIEFSP